MSAFVFSWLRSSRYRRHTSQQWNLILIDSEYCAAKKMVQNIHWSRQCVRVHCAMNLINNKMQRNRTVWIRIADMQCITCGVANRSRHVCEEEQRSPSASDKRINYDNVLALKMRVQVHCVAYLHSTFDNFIWKWRISAATRVIISIRTHILYSIESEIEKVRWANRHCSVRRLS